MLSAMRDGDIELLRKLWQRVVAFGYLDSEKAMGCFMESLLERLDANGATWIAAVRKKDTSEVNSEEMNLGWRIIDIFGVDAKDVETTALERLKLYTKVRQEYGFDPITSRAVELSGKLRAVLRRDVISDEEWGEHWLNVEYCEKLGRLESMVGVYPVDVDCESYVVFHRRAGREPFSESDREFVMTAISGLGQLHRALMLLRGAMFPLKMVLSPKERAILKYLLAGKREKDVAMDMDIAVSTAHNHITSIYRKFDASGKMGIFSRVLGV